MTSIMLAVLLSQSPTLTVNGRALTAQEQALVPGVPAGAYWYDTMTGAYGLFGGPTAGFIAPGLGLGGRLPANASGGGSGRLTGVFINGRELHPIDVQQLSAYLGMPLQLGRFWVDAQGNAGAEGGPFLFNLHALARANGRGGGGGVRVRDDGRGNRSSVGNGAAVIHQKTGSGESERTTSTYIGLD